MSKQVNEEAIKWRADPKRMHNLRMRFVEQCKQYFGVPYAKKYQEPGSKTLMSNFLKSFFFLSFLRSKIE